MHLEFHGAAGTVTGSCFLVTTENEKFLVDCGMFQGSKELKERNYGPFMFDPAEIDCVFLTHAHIDHSGLIPKLYKHGFRGEIHTTEATKQLCAVVLPDSAYIQEMEVERKNRKRSRSGEPLLEPIYTVEHAQKCQEYIRGYHYNEEIVINQNITARFLDAGHILGSAIIELVVKDGQEAKKLIFSGDIGNINQPIVSDPTKIFHADVVVMESTYGNRYHIETENKLDVLTRIIKNTIKKGGNLVIPSFAVERTQDLIVHLKSLMEEGRIPEIDVFIDSPMAVEATKVFMENPAFCTDEAFCSISGEEARKFFESPHIHYVVTTEESIALNKMKKGAIIISASGMADAGRIKHHLKHNLWRPESTVLFVGYQAEGTLGRRILEGEKRVRIHGEEIAVKASIEKIDGFSSHADQKGLVDWIGSLKSRPDNLFLVHGEADALLTLQRVIKNETGFQAIIPELGAKFKLEKGTCELTAERERSPRELPASDLSHVFELIKKRIGDLAGMQGSDVRTMQRMLAQINELERELSKTG